MHHITRAIRRAMKATFKRAGSSLELPDISYDPDDYSNQILSMPAPANPWFERIGYRIIYQGGPHAAPIDTTRWGLVLAKLLIILSEHPEVLEEHVKRTNKQIYNWVHDHGSRVVSTEYLTKEYMDPRNFLEETLNSQADLLNQMLRTRVEIEVTGDSLKPVTKKIALHGTSDNDMRHGFANSMREHRRLYHMACGRHKMTIEPIINKLLNTMDRGQRDRLVSFLIDNPIASLNTRAYEPNWNRNQLTERGIPIPEMLESIRFKSGHIMGRVRLNEQITWNNKRLSLYKMQLASTYATSLIGQPLGKLIDHEALDLDALIEDIKYHENGKIVVYTDNRPEILDLSTISQE